MPRYIKNTVVLSKLETVYGTNAAPTGALNAVLISDVTITPLDAKMIDRNNIKGFFGANEQLVGPASVKLGITTELAGSGAAATPPAWGTLLLGCAMAEGLLETPARVEYTPVTSGLKSITNLYYDDGLLHPQLGAMGDFSLSAKVGERPVFKFEFTGLVGTVSVADNPTGVFTAWKMPVAMTQANVTDITLGGTYALGAVTGGTVYPSSGLDFKMGNKVNFNPLLSSESVDITDREVTGSIELELTATQELALLDGVKAGTKQTLALTIGTVTGAKVIIFLAAVQLSNHKKVDFNGKRMVGFDIRAVPVAGNDELRIVCL
jgi:hypothetical protein